MSPTPLPFAKSVELTGKGPFQLPRMKGVLSFGGTSWDWPVLRLETVNGDAVLVPLAAEAVNALRLDVQEWLRNPNNPLSDPRD